MQQIFGTKIRTKGVITVFPFFTFYSNYLSDENEPHLRDVPAAGTYEKSLSSLIFLSFGIFLLISINEHLSI